MLSRSPPLSQITNAAPPLERRVSVAPMMAYTDRHCRYFMRLLSPSALLYTEMVTSQALLHSEPRRHLDFDAGEQPVALQLGGSEPDDLAVAARLGEEFGYREINLNCGCPSERVRKGSFGACLMDEPALVADCVRAMRASVSLPVTVKCRIGIEPTLRTGSDYDLLAEFVAAQAEAGCSVFIIHARKAMLSGLSPKENREIPPLRYEVAERLRCDFPQLQFILNGGIRSVSRARELLERFDGVMIGREAYQNPYMLTELHDLRHRGHVEAPPPDGLPHRGAGDDGLACRQPPRRAQVLERYLPYVRARLAEGDSLRQMLRPLHGLLANLPGARAWRRLVSELSARSSLSTDGFSHSGGKSEVSEHDALPQLDELRSCLQGLARAA